MFDKLDFVDVPTMRGQSVYVPQGYVYIRHINADHEEKQEEFRLIFSKDDFPAEWGRVGLAVSGSVMRVKDGRQVKAQHNVNNVIIPATTAAKHTSLKEYIKGDKFAPVHVTKDALFVEFLELEDEVV